MFDSIIAEKNSNEARLNFPEELDQIEFNTNEDVKAFIKLTELNQIEVDKIEPIVAAAKNRVKQLEKEFDELENTEGKNKKIIEKGNRIEYNKLEKAKRINFETEIKHKELVDRLKARKEELIKIRYDSRILMYDSLSFKI